MNAAEVLLASNHGGWSVDVPQICCGLLLQPRLMWFAILARGRVILLGVEEVLPVPVRLAGTAQASALGESPYSRRPEACVFE